MTLAFALGTLVIPAASASSSDPAHDQTSPTPTAKRASRRAEVLVIRGVSRHKPGPPRAKRLRSDLKRIERWSRQISKGRAARLHVRVRTVRIPDRWTSCRRQSRDPASLVQVADRLAHAGLPKRSRDLHVLVTHCRSGLVENAFSQSIGFPSWSRANVAAALLSALEDERRLAGSYVCSAGDLPTTFAGTCAAYPGGDPFSLLSTGTRFPATLNAQDMVALGWLKSSRVATLRSGGTVTLTPLHSSGRGQKALRIRLPRPPAWQVDLSRWLWVELRTRAGDDLAAARDGSRGYGVQLRLDEVQGPSLWSMTGLVDATPGSDPEDDLGDAALPAGASVTTPGGIRITVMSESDRRAVVQVRYSGRAATDRAFVR